MATGDYIVYKKDKDDDLKRGKIDYLYKDGFMVMKDEKGERVTSLNLYDLHTVDYGYVLMPSDKIEVNAKKGIYFDTGHSCKVKIYLRLQRT